MGNINLYGWETGDGWGYLVTIPSPSFEKTLDKLKAKKMGEYTKNGITHRLQYIVSDKLLKELNIPIKK